MKKISRRSFLAATAALAAASLTAGCSGPGDGKTHLTFQIWDVAQRDGMQAMCDAYTVQHPDVVIEVQVTSWNEYWTKLEAATMARQAPDIFWMHTNEILKYADNGKLPDCSAIVETEHFSDISLANASGSDGKLYAVPKDKDSVGLVYNKEMFDAAGVSYPDDTWTWDTLCEASQKIYDATGYYGYMAYGDDQLGYWNFVYQAGGSILTEDKKFIFDQLMANFNGECSEVGMYLCMARIAHREGYPEIGLYWEKAAYEEAEHAAKFAELLGEVVTDSTKKNLEMRVDAENGATAGKFELAKKAKELGLDAIHDTVHEMARDEARHGKAFEGLLKRYFNA